MAEVWNHGLGFQSLCCQLQSLCWCFSSEGLEVCLECLGRYLTSSPPAAATGIRKKNKPFIFEQKEIHFGNFRKIQILQPFLQSSPQALLLHSMTIAVLFSSPYSKMEYLLNPKHCWKFTRFLLFSSFYLRHSKVQKTIMMWFKRQKFGLAKLSMNPCAMYRL